MNRVARTVAAASAFVFAVFSLPAQGQDALLLTYQRNFIRANLAVKTDILREAAQDEMMAASLGALNEYALNFALQYADILRDDADLTALAAHAAASAGRYSNAASAQTLWRLFMAFRDSEVRTAALASLSVLGRGDGRVIENLNQFLANQNNLHRSGMTADYSVLAACIDTLGTLGDGSSFSVLFSAMIAGYPADIGERASLALSQIRGDYKKYLIDVIRRNPPVEKLAAFAAGANNLTFSPADLGELAENSLEVTLGLIPADAADENAVTELRYAAVRLLTEQRWTRATTLAIKHFYRVQTDYDKGAAPKERFLEAIRCLGAMGSSEAAQALSLQLGLMNSRMERNRDFDPELLTALIGSLGDIGDKVAFDYLLYIGFLPYPDAVQTAAREALNRLKW